MEFSLSISFNDEGPFTKDRLSVEQVKYTVDKQSTVVKAKDNNLCSWTSQNQKGEGMKLEIEVAVRDSGNKKNSN